MPGKPGFMHYLKYVNIIVKSIQQFYTKVFYSKPHRVLFSKPHRALFLVKEGILQLVTSLVMT